MLNLKKILEKVYNNLIFLYNSLPSLLLDELVFVPTK